MTGSRHQWKNRGIIPRSLSYIFDKFTHLTDQGFIASAFLSYLEIYNENGYDLLHSGFSSGRIEDLKKVQLLEDAQQQIHMKNLTVHPIKSEDEAMQLLYLGDHNRIIAETPMNEASTRSHCIFTIHINIREGDSSTVRRSKVHLVDLAGSERLANSNSSGQLFHEARHINLALHYLEQVIVALGEAHRSHIPYRNSMMTSILRDSLGGNCMTSMIATLSLEQRNILETMSTCRFSQRVALVTNAAMLNEETDPMLLIAQLKTENKRLKDIIANSSIRPVEQNSEPLSQEEVADCWKLVEKFISDYDEEAILPIPPDMRMVQTCFRCLKMAVQMNKDDILGITSNGSPSFKLKDPPVSFLDDHHAEATLKYSSDMTREQLLEALRTRDAEIDVLTKMLKPQKKNTSRSTKNECHSRANSMEHGDGPIKFATQRKHSAKIRSDCSDCEDLKEKPMTAYQKMTIHHLEETSPLALSKQKEFDSENFHIAGLSDTKREAFESFLGACKGRDKLENVRNSLLTKRNEKEMLESLLNRNYANHKNLQLVVMNAEDMGEDRAFIQDAIEAQAKSIENQEVQLKDIEVEMRSIESELKQIYAQIMQDFERHWISMKEVRDKTAFLGTDTESKPFSEVTKGIVKGVGGALIPLVFTEIFREMESFVSTSCRRS
ncbi:unnamed protein product [Orchesella dallaii]|uniref:Kinesin-like protein n=1 Tax=Orchesella dallaii TaxID=48710 RepID=A0ABP1QCZ2_9HEXA